MLNFISSHITSVGYKRTDTKVRYLYGAVEAEKYVTSFNIPFINQIDWVLFKNIIFKETIHLVVYLTDEYVRWRGSIRGLWGPHVEQLRLRSRQGRRFLCSLFWNGIWVCLVNYHRLANVKPATTRHLPQMRCNMLLRFHGDIDSLTGFLSVYYIVLLNKFFTKILIKLKFLNLKLHKTLSVFYS